MADSNRLSGFYLPSAKKINEDHLVNRTWRAVICSGLAVLLVVCVANEVGSDRYSSLLSSICGGLVAAVCPAIAVSFTLFLGWGVSVAVLRRLNVILGSPLNPSAIAALGAGFGCALVHSAMVAQLVLASSKGTLTESPTFLIYASAILGCILVQVAARISVRREIARHNLRADHIPFKEPPCDVKFQISQMMILTAAISLLCAVAMHLVGGSLIMLIALWCVLIASTFFPAILIANWVESKMGHVKLKPWEEVRTIDWETELATIAAAQAQRSDNTLADDTPTDDTSANAEQLICDLLPQHRSAARYAQHGALTAACVWTSFAGSFFCVLFVISHETSQAIQGIGSQFDGLINTIPLGFAGAVLGIFLAVPVTALLWLFNLTTGERMRTGTIAAFAGSFVAAAGASLVVWIGEIVHEVPWNGAIDCFSKNNHFPLAMILLACMMGQTFARLGVKRHRRKAGLSIEECRAESSGPPWGRYCIRAWIFAACGWILLIANNDAAAITPATASDYMLSFLLATFASTATVWPLANFFTRLVNWAPKSVQEPAFSTLLQPSQMKAPL